jgi:uncharacterized membrane protein YphA (DoxX/SURF4 family)
MKKYMPIVARILLGFVLFASGIAGLLNLVPIPENLPADLTTFNQGLMASRYFFPLLKITEIVCGFLLLSGFFVPLALVILAPVVLNIFLVHAFLEPSGTPLALILGLLMIYLSFFAAPYAPKIRSLFKAR